MGAALQLNSSQLDLIKDIYHGMGLFFQIVFALDGFYRDPSRGDYKVPKNWNPIFIHCDYGTFDPYMNSSRLFYDPLFEPWEDCNGIEKTRMMMREIQEKMNRTHYHTRLHFGPDIHVKTGRIIRHEFFRDLMGTHFITTREKITENSIIIGFFHLETKTFKRYLIKDVTALCKALRLYDGDFDLLLGRIGIQKTDENYYSYDYNAEVTDEYLTDKILSLVSDASSYRIQNEHVLEMLKILRGETNNVYYINKSLAK